MNRDELLELREKLVNKTRKLALSEESDPARRLEVLMGLIRSGDASREMIHQAIETVEQIPEEDRLDVYLDLIFEIDAQLGVDADEQAD